MKWIFVLFSITNLFSNPVEPPIKFVQVEEYADFVLINYNESFDLSEKRLIEVFNEKGKRIYKCKTRKGEVISELNMTQVKNGKYLIKTHIGDNLVEHVFIKK